MKFLFANFIKPITHVTFQYNCSDRQRTNIFTRVSTNKIDDITNNLPQNNIRITLKHTLKIHFTLKGTYRIFIFIMFFHYMYLFFFFFFGIIKYKKKIQLHIKLRYYHRNNIICSMVLYSTIQTLLN